jgi:sialate O-acetylesterase
MPLAYQYKFTYCFIVFFVLSPLTSIAASWELRLDLKGKWKFHIGDNQRWADITYNDSQWDEVQVPAAWETQGFHAYDGFAWYRKTFELTEDLSQEKLYLSLGYIDDVDEVYINGKLIGFSGSFPPYFQTAYSAFRRYHIPEEYLNPGGKNTIAIRVYDAKIDGGILSGMIGLVSNPDYNRLDVDLSGLWEFRLGDNVQWKDEENGSAHWEKVMAPLFWEKQGFVNYDGYAWYRKIFYLPKKMEGENQILLLGMIDDYDQTFVNGQLVGSTGFDENGQYNVNDDFAYTTVRKYDLNPEVLKYGDLNTITIRVFDKIIDGGIYNGPLGIISQDKYTDFWRRWWR